VPRSSSNRIRCAAASDNASWKSMRYLLIALALCSASGVLIAACSQDPTSAATSTSGTGGAPNCEGVYFVSDDKDGGNPCDICLHDNCCAESADCRDQACINCVNTLLPSCGPKPRAVTNCLNLHCTATCGHS
jgi:hypothetical protein